MNAYNPTILKYWKGNQDIQIVNSAERIVYYVCAHLCKAEPGELKHAMSALRIEMHNLQIPTSQRKRMLKIGCSVLKERRLRAQEAAFRPSNPKFITLVEKPSA